jgi:hypothetical protein
MARNRTRFLTGSIVAAVLVAGLGAASMQPRAGEAGSQGPTVAGETGSALSADAVRAQGPNGLKRFVSANAEKIQAAKAHAEAGLVLGTEEQSFLGTIDSIAGQKDAAWSELYWYTDLEAAKTAAAAERKPILSLRLLGKLTDEFSCANSRFFRVALYANQAISSHLRENFILHWSTERPVPKITIDYGDGRRIERTITGNSVHYVLAPDGTVVDALPGLYSPHVFLKNLRRASEANRSYGGQWTPLHRSAYLAALSSELDGLVNLRAGVSSIPPSAAPAKAAVIDPAAAPKPPNAAKAGALALSKSGDEFRMLRAVGIAAVEPPVVPLAVQAGELGLAGELDESSAGLMAAHLNAGTNNVAEPAPEDGRDVKAHIQAIAFNVQRALFTKSMSADTVVNEIELRPQIIKYLSSPSGQRSGFDALNTWVYSSVFLTPKSDPWLGLRNDEVYDGLRRTSSILGTVAEPVSRDGKPGGPR